MTRKAVTQLKRNIHLLKAIHKARPTRRCELLKSADTDLIESLCACIRNIANGNIPISEGRKRTLSKHKKLLLQLADPSTSGIAKKRLVVKQKGGFFGAILPAILGPVLGAVSSLLTS